MFALSSKARDARNRGDAAAYASDSHAIMDLAMAAILTGDRIGVLNIGRKSDGGFTGSATEVGVGIPNLAVR